MDTISETLIICEGYPSKDEPAGMFVHKRVKFYQSKGLKLHPNILSIKPFLGTVVNHRKLSRPTLSRVYDGVKIIEGSESIIREALDKRTIGTVCVHFLSAAIFRAIRPYLGKIRLIVWLHGWEIQPWWRRKFNLRHVTPVRKFAVKLYSMRRMKFFRELFATSTTINSDIHFVFVSQYFADEVMEDYKLKLPESIYTIIHNGIDTEKFRYEEKSAEQRKNIFICRPWSTRPPNTTNYSNDLIIKSIIAISKEEEFSDMQFYITGKGHYFNDWTKALREFSNIKLENRFFTHEELFSILKDFGVCFNPTRSDTQGVFRDEAMSSGLVPITNAVAAISEFCDESCAMLVPAEDWQGMADAMLELYHNPDLFCNLSRNAAARVRKQSDMNLMIQREIELITYPGNQPHNKSHSAQS